ncbi:MAG: hypothetical protein JO027_06810 [Solirubrobacterales bacterium]|nr:hypothetical protein [Solirubrobacterales bacterium]
MNYRIIRRGLGLAVLLATVAGGSAQAAAPAQTSACSQPGYTFSQPFISLGDSNWYTLVPGQSQDSFIGTGWTLTGGAKLVTTTLADGSVGTVLDLPAGATAVSPPMCVNSQYPDARVDLRQLGNGAALHAYVAYTGGKSQGQSSGALNGSSTWSVSRAFQLHAGNLVGWQDAQYTFVGDKGEAQVYDFYVDPHCFG